MTIKWASSRSRMRRNGGLFVLGDVVPQGYFSDEELASLVSRGHVVIDEPQVVEAVEVPELEQPQAPELEQPKGAELEQPQVPELEHEGPEGEELEHGDPEGEELEGLDHEPEIDLGSATDKSKTRKRRRRA